MFKIESYVTPILLSYVDKYVRDFKPADAQVSLWGGGVALHNLVLKADVLQQEVALPFTLVSGRIHELLIQVPWTKIMSESIIVTIDTIECVLSLNPPAPQDDAAPTEPQRRTQVVEAPPGYMQALVRRIVSNIALRVHHLIVKYVQDDIVLSLNVKHLSVDSAGINWEPSFADIDQAEPVIRRLMRLDDLTLCLDRSDSDGKIRFYQEPLLYRCQLDLRILTRLVSANTRRASSLSVHLSSTKLAWGVTSDQLLLLLRLLRELPTVEAKTVAPVLKTSSVTQATQLHTMSSNSAEPARQESWSEWAWSWLPTWMDREGAVEEAPMPATPIPVHFVAYFDDVSLIFKVMEQETTVRKRARGVLELRASHAAVKSSMRSPTMMRVRIGLRTITLLSRGKCICGHVGPTASKDEATIYLSKVNSDKAEDPWTWPEEDLTDTKVELAQDADEALREIHISSDICNMAEQPEVDGAIAEDLPSGSTLELDPLWHKMAPVLFMDYCHERSPPLPYVNPYENPPTVFEYSDWVEICTMKFQLEPLEVQLTTGLLHRITAIKNVLNELNPVPVSDLPTRTLTIEECEALLENLPQKRITVDIREMRVRLMPWDHVATEASIDPPLMLDIEIPKALFVITGPLYPHRVCSAACQMPQDSGPLWTGARLHISGAVKSAQARLWSGGGAAQPGPCARADLRFVIHHLMNQHLFQKNEIVVFSYSIKIREANVCGSAARLQAAYQVPMSLFKEKVSLPLKHTTLARDAIYDEEAVAVDLTFEELSLRGYLTKNVNTHILSLQSARATAYHSPIGAEVKQAWLFSAPDTPTTTPYLRSTVQWCDTPSNNSLDYIGMWTEPISFCLDPLFIAWLAYKPNRKPYMESPSSTTRNMSSTQFLLRRRPTPPSSSARISRSGSGAELVHVRPRSHGSSSEPSERRDNKPVLNTAKSTTQWWNSDRVLSLHGRLQRALINVELGLVLAYVPSSSASAVDCVTVRDAMERHAMKYDSVLTVSFGRISMHSNTSKKHLWQLIRHDGPTFINAAFAEGDSFPWKLRLADVSCYSLDVPMYQTDRAGHERHGLRSQLKYSGVVCPKNILEIVTTTVTLSVVTKFLQIKTAVKKESKKTSGDIDEEKTKYFTSGMDFKPSTLKEFFRGPAKRKKTTEEAQPLTDSPPPVQVTQGPVVSLGVHLHADTPPVIVRLDREQVHLVATALHGLQHILKLLQRSPPVMPKNSYTSVASSHRSLIRSVSEMDELRTPSEETPTENRSELISIFESQSTQPVIKMKTFFWFQWVVSRATLVVATRNVKLAFDVDDIISTVDLQAHYNQMKVKIASASVRHYERTLSDEWTVGVLGGRILEAREPTNAMEENHFMSVTITQAQVSNLPANWKEELNPKLLEEKQGIDSMWEICATLAPLEAVMQPTVLENIMSLVHEFSPHQYCPLQAESKESISSWQWPYCFVNAGGLRLLLTVQDENKDIDDTFILSIGKLTVSPHPENPICRRAINNEATWMGGGGPFEGRQYEVLINNCGIRSAQFKELVYQETSEKDLLGTGGENPALKWSQPVVAPTITPLLHSLDIGFVLAPAMYVSGSLACGPAVELNLVSDCSFEMSVDQLNLIRRALAEFAQALSERPSGPHERKKYGVCPYASFLTQHAHDDPPTAYSDTMFTDETYTMKTSPEAGPSVATDSGVDTVTSHSTLKTNSRVEDAQPNVKKTVSIAFLDSSMDPSDYLEVFVTMGVIEVSLYTSEDGSSEVAALKPPDVPLLPATTEPALQINVIFENNEAKDEAGESIASRTKSLTEACRPAAVGKTKLADLPHARKCAGNLPLLHLTLYQPNLYYWRKKAQKSLQVSLFNAWMGLGIGQIPGHWSAALLSTTKGVPDPVTDIPPALATIKYTTPAGGNSSRGTIRVDIERPVQFEVCTDRIRRLKRIMKLIDTKSSNNTDVAQLPFLYRMRQFLVCRVIENVTVQTGQISVCGSEGAVGWDSWAVQLASAARPERLRVRGALTALLVTAGPPADARHVLLHPLTLGYDVEATWEAWRRAEGGRGAYEPMVRLSVDVDRVTADVRPAELGAVFRLKRALASAFPVTKPSLEEKFNYTFPDPLNRPSGVTLSQNSSKASVESDIADHYYKDDLRSGAFKMVSGGQLPMAYQVTVNGQSVAWRYPHPRAITKIFAFPLPDQEKEIDCVLEFYSPMQDSWHEYTYFSVPVAEPKEILLFVNSPDAVFAQMWRFRPYVKVETKQRPFEFDFSRYMPKTSLMMWDYQPQMQAPDCSNSVTAEQLSGVVRVDSFFAPKALPRTRVSIRVAGLEVYMHNSLPSLSSQATALEGYYVSRPLMRSHRVLALVTRDIAAHAHIGSQTGCKAMLTAVAGSDVIDCATGTMVSLVEEFRLQMAASVPEGDNTKARVRCLSSGVHVALHVPRLKSLHTLAADWTTQLEKYMTEQPAEPDDEQPLQAWSKREAMVATAAALDGRVCLWVHNSCAAALRIGQDGTDELVPLGPGARLAYRWRSPNTKKMLRIALAGPMTDWHWSPSVPFTVGSFRVRLEDAEALGSKSNPGGGVYAHIRVEESGARRTMHLAGRLTLANMLRYNLLYKVRARCPDVVTWRTVCSGELEAEGVGRSVLCGADCEMALKIKFTSHDTGWSGDIPLKECPKENVPWLVKVPSEGDIPYTSVWCRIVRARGDGRVLATVWPLYVLYSHLPLDTEVLIKTDTSVDDATDDLPSQLIQTATGRGTSTHLVAPGTTAARHTLSFQYRNIECPVTKEAVPLHYGVTDTSVFDKRAPVTNIEEVVQDIHNWLSRSGRNAKSSWPYSVVAKFWPGTWQPALMQPRSDITIRYEAVRAGGGCCLELQLSPVALLCNAAPLALTLRAHDAAPLCKLEPGTAISPPYAVLKKPFFISVEIGRETFVSGQLEVSGVEPGRYGSPPPGHVILDHPAPLAIHCNHKVALLTMYYEIKEEINVLGMSTTFELVNFLDTNILVSPIVVPHLTSVDAELRPKTFKVVEPSEELSIHGTALCRFWLSSRWRGGDPSELTPFLCVALPADGYPAAAPVPVRLALPPYRRAFALIDVHKNSVPVVVSQVQHDGRWLVTVARDPCPQLVVHNRTRAEIVLAQPTAPAPRLSHNTAPDDHINVQAVAECPGTSWHCVVTAGAAVHYSSPAHCARYPPSAVASAAPTQKMQFLTFARPNTQSSPYWCAPVAVAEGEQLLQLYGGLTLKLRVRTHPHSTLVELQDVDQTDISASDIRKRLLGTSTSKDIHVKKKDFATSSTRLERTHGDDHLLNKYTSEDGGESSSRSEPLIVTLLGHSSSEQTPMVPRQDEDSLEDNSDEMAVIKDISNSRISAHRNMSEQLYERRPSESVSKIFTGPDTSPLQEVSQPEWNTRNAPLPPSEKVRIVIASLSVELGASAETPPLVALHLERAALLMQADDQGIKTTVSVAGVQIDNLQYESGQYDFAVVASAASKSATALAERWPPVWSMLMEEDALSTRRELARLLLHLRHDTWTVVGDTFTELTEVEISVGPLSLYVEDAYVSALVELGRMALPGVGGEGGEVEPAVAETRTLLRPLRLQALLVRPLDLTLTLHTAVRMYIALDQSPLRLGAFRLKDTMTSVERLTHALTVHYLSAAILGAGWVVGGLELLGAPGALAARLGGASGGVRGVASAAAAALLRSLSACAGSLARNLDLLAGDEEHARRAAAARRRPPPSLVAGLVAGITNFAINILGAVGGLAHHPLVGVAVGETESSATALRRSLLGALTKPLSATADLVAYAGQGLLTQTGWDPVPQPRASHWPPDSCDCATGWRRDCVRWAFRLAELSAICGYEVLLDNAPLQLLLTHKFLVVVDSESERIVEMIDFRFCSLAPYSGLVIELCVTQRRTSKNTESRAIDEDDEYQISAAAMARVARYTGAGGVGAGAVGGGGGSGAGGVTDARTLALVPAPGRALALHAMLTAAIKHNCDTHFSLL